MSLLISKKIILGGQIDEFLKGGGDDANPNGIDQSMANVPPYRKGYPFVHSRPTLWANQRLAFDALDQ